MRFVIDKKRLDSYYHYTRYDDNDSSVLSVVETGTMIVTKFDTGWSIYSKQAEEDKDAWVDAVLKFQKNTGIKGPADILHMYVQEVRDAFTMDEQNWPEHKSVVLPSLGAAMSLVEGLDNCKDETIEKILNGGTVEIPTPKAVFKYAWQSTRYNIGLDVKKTLYNIGDLGIQVFVTPVLDAMDMLIDAIFVPLNAVYEEIKRIAHKCIKAYKDLEELFEDENKRKILRDKFLTELKKFGKDIQEYIYMILCIDVFIQIFKQLKHLWNTKESIWESFMSKLKCLVDFDYKSLGSDIINQIAEHLWAFLPLFGSLFGALIAKLCVDDATVEADRQAVANALRAETSNPDDITQALRDKVDELQTTISNSSEVYSYAIKNVEDFSLYNVQENSSTNDSSYNELEELSIDDIGCKISMCPQNPPIDPTSNSPYSCPSTITIEFGKDFTNAVFTVTEGQSINIGDIIGYIENVKVKSKYQFKVIKTSNRYIVGEYIINTDLLDLTLTEEDMKSNADKYVNSLNDTYSVDDSFNNLHSVLMENANIETFILNYLLYCRIPQLALNKNDGKGKSIGDCIKGNNELADKMKEKYGDEFKKVAGKDNVSDKCSNGSLIGLKKEIDSLKQKMIADIMKEFNDGYKHKSKGRVEDFLLFDEYLDYLLSDGFRYDEDNRFVVELYNAIVEFISIRQTLEINEENINNLIKKFNEYCVKNIKGVLTCEENDYYKHLSKMFPYEYYKPGDDIIAALESDDDKMSRYSTVYNYLQSLSKLPADQKQDITLDENDDVQKILDNASSQSASFNKTKAEEQAKLQKIAIYYNTIRKVEINIENLDISEFTDENEIDKDLLLKYAADKNVASYYLGETNKLGVKTRTYLAPYLESLIKLTQTEANRIQAILDSCQQNDADPYKLLKDFIEMPWPSSYALYWKDTQSDFFLFSPNAGTPLPPTSMADLEKAEEDSDRGRPASPSGNDDMMDSPGWGETAYGIDKINYWLKYCKMATLMHCCLPMYWSTGLVIPPVPYILLPVIYIPFVVIPRRVTIVIGLGLCGIMPLPMILFVNTGALNGSLIPMINIMVDMLLQLTNQLTAAEKPVINASIDPLIESLNQEIKDLEVEEDLVKKQMEELSKIKQSKEVANALEYSYSYDFTNKNVECFKYFPLSDFTVPVDQLGGMNADDAMELFGDATAILNKSFDEVKGDIDKRHKEYMEAIARSKTAEENAVGDGYIYASSSYIPNIDVPNGFPTDKQLIAMLKNAEGIVLIKWANSPDGPPLTDSDQNGFDLPGGVHSLSIVKQIGVTPAQSIGLSSLDKVKWVFCRKAIGSEKGNGYTATLSGNKKYKYTSDITASDDYYNKLLKVYRPKIAKAWQLDRVKRESNNAIKLAMCHTISWFYGWNPDAPCNDQGWNHRVEAAAKALQTT